MTPSSSKKLYVVSTEVDVVVRAESREEAQRIASDQRASDLMQSNVAADWNATEMMWLPGDWDLNSLPYSDSDDNKTIRELIEAGEAPGYAAQRALAKRREEFSSK